MDVSMKQAIRAMRRLYSAWSEGAEQNEMCDRAFDGGEWSGSAWAQIYEDRYNYYISMISNRFDIDKCDFELALLNAPYNEMEHERNALSNGECLEAYH